MPALIQFASGAPGIKYPIEKRFVSIGRGSADNDICLPCRFVSKHHAVIEIVEDESGGEAYVFFLQDLDSKNHTYVNDQPITRVQLKDGDMIRIGRNSLKFDAKGKTPALDAIDLAFESSTPDDSQAKTWNFSRRLRLISLD
ncbi:MAG: FHA domain-containing protein [Gammaproteobacteria bacterium]|nr:FHA domain-containing protein [Gammaproteobacteria bacterium]